MRKRKCSARRVREAIWKKDPRCFWCGVVTILIKNRERPGKNNATLDHVFNKKDSRRQPGNPGPRVLACFQCNQKRSRERETKIFIENEEILF